MSSKKKKRISKLETIFTNPEIQRLIEQIKEGDAFKGRRYEDVANSQEINLLRSLLVAEEALAEKVLYHRIGKLFSGNFFQKGHEHFYETRWQIGDSIKEIVKKSPLKGGYVHDYELLDPVMYPELNDFRIDDPKAILLSGLNIIKPLKGESSRVKQIRLRLKSPGSSALKITESLFNKNVGSVRDRLGCKLYCVDAPPKERHCYAILKSLKNDIRGEVDSGKKGIISIMSPWESNIEDAIKKPRKGKKDLRIIFTNTILEPSGTIFRTHIEPLQTLKVEKESKGKLRHDNYKQILWEETVSKWSGEQWRVYHTLRDVLQIKYEY